MMAMVTEMRMSAAMKAAAGVAADADGGEPMETMLEVVVLHGIASAVDKRMDLAWIVVLQRDLPRRDTAAADDDYG